MYNCRWPALFQWIKQFYSSSSARNPGISFLARNDGTAYAWITNAEYNSRRNGIQWFWHNHSHPPATRNPGICFPPWNAKFFTSQHAEWMSSYKWTHTKYGQSLQRIWHKFIIGSTMIYINFWWQLCKFSNLYSMAIDLRCSLCIFTVILLYNVTANTFNPLRGWINNTTMYINSWQSL